MGSDYNPINLNIPNEYNNPNQSIGTDITLIVKRGSSADSKNKNHSASYNYAITL